MTMMMMMINCVHLNTGSPTKKGIQMAMIKTFADNADEEDDDDENEN